MGNIETIDRGKLKTAIINGIKESVAAYEQDIPRINPYKQTKYKTWNKIFKSHDLISVDYDVNTKEYSIRIREREENTHSYGSSIPGCDFTLSEAEFDERFDEIMDFLISKVEPIE